MNMLREYVSGLDDDDKVHIIQDYEVLERTGVLGDEPLRQHASAFFERYNIDHPSVIVWMQLMAFECHRHFSLRYITEVYY